jgi:hypothetical protein
VGEDFLSYFCCDLQDAIAVCADTTDRFFSRTTRQENDPPGSPLKLYPPRRLRNAQLERIASQQKNKNKERILAVPRRKKGKPCSST